jgi:hypothetical protein
MAGCDEWDASRMHLVHMGDIVFRCFDIGDDLNKCAQCIEPEVSNSAAFCISAAANFPALFLTTPSSMAAGSIPKGL